MEFRTKVAIEPLPFLIEPSHRLLFTGSCFADNIGLRFLEEHFRAAVNPFGTMYNPASVLHSVERTPGGFDIAFLTLGTNHVYRLRATGEIVDNCQKRPQSLFQEKELPVETCVDYLCQAVERLGCPVVITVSPIRYAKYGFAGSQLSKATLLLAAREVCRRNPGRVAYFPAYEIVLDELRDYRFYKPDMLHPSQQAVDYIFERLIETMFSPAARRFLAEWQPIKKALAHRPFNADSAEYIEFLARARQQEADLLRRYGIGEE